MCFMLYGRLLEVVRCHAHVGSHTFRAHFCCETFSFLLYFLLTYTPQIPLETTDEEASPVQTGQELGASDKNSGHAQKS
jgi:hypothetical protein